jgi:hypothetical protein
MRTSFAALARTRHDVLKRAGKMRRVDLRQAISAQASAIWGAYNYRRIDKTCVQRYNFANGLYDSTHQQRIYQRRGEHH